MNACETSYAHVILASMDAPNRNEANENEWLTPAEAGMKLPRRLGAAAVRKWARNGKLPGAIQLPSGRWLIPESAISEIYRGAEAV